MPQVNTGHANNVQVHAVERDWTDGGWMWLLLSGLLALAALPHPVSGQYEVDAERENAAAERIAERHEKLKQKHGNDENYLIKPGLIADRADRTVTLHAWATGLSDTAAVEFWVIPRQSGKAYESLSVTPARPSDIHAALEFIGMAPGRPVNYSRHQYWPKGERVRVTFQFTPAGVDEPRSFPAEALIFDKRTDDTLPEVGLVFTGSYTYEENGQSRYAADHSDAMSIASTYNERSTVLDTPRMAFQGDVYSYLLPAEPTHGLKPGQPIDITLKPTRDADDPRVIDLALHVRADPADGPAGRDDLWFIIEGHGENARQFGSFTELTRYLTDLSERRDPFVTFHLADPVSLQAAKQVARLLREMEGEAGIRVEAPPEGQLYYLAWLPDAGSRPRENRPWAGHELHVQQTKNGLAGELIALRENFKADPPRTEAVPHDVASAEDVAAVYRNADRAGQPLVIFAPREITVGNLLQLIQPAITQSDPIYIFLPEPN